MKPQDYLNPTEKARLDELNLRRASDIWERRLLIDRGKKRMKRANANLSQGTVETER